MKKTITPIKRQSIRPSPDALLDPKCDATFKALFTDNSDEARLALKSFLEAVLGAKVSNIELRPNETSIESLSDKQAQFDITCTLNDSEAVNIEMQGINVSQAYDKRAEFYVAHLLNHYTTSGIGWDEVPKVFQISVLNFIYDETVKTTMTTYTMKSDDDRRLSDRMTVIFIELPKIKILPDDAKSLTSAEKWGKFLLYANEGERKDFIKTLYKSEEGIMAAQNVLSKISEDEVNWLRQMSRDKWERDVLTVKNQARRDGIREGEHNARIATAMNLLKMGLSEALVSEGTGLSLEQVMELSATI